MSGCRHHLNWLLSISVSSINFLMDSESAAPRLSSPFSAFSTLDSSRLEHVYDGF
jgi:hypothetical protein